MIEVKNKSNTVTKLDSFPNYICRAPLVQPTIGLLIIIVEINVGIMKIM